MADKIRDVMTSDPSTCEASDSAVDAAKAMRDGEFGAVIVADQGQMAGIVTDRDIAVRVVAEGRDPGETALRDIASSGLETLSPDDSIDEAVQKMRDADVRRLPVVEDSRAVGIVSIGDLAVARDERSALADISAAAPNN
jgi:CBS domain-containing protein